MIVFIREAPIDDSTALECIPTVVATGAQRMFVKFYNFTDTKQSANDTPRIPVHAA